MFRSTYAFAVTLSRYPLGQSYDYRAWRACLDCKSQGHNDWYHINFCGRDDTHQSIFAFGKQRDSLNTTTSSDLGSRPSINLPLVSYRAPKGYEDSSSIETDSSSDEEDTFRPETCLGSPEISIREFDQPAETFLLITRSPPNHSPQTGSLIPLIAIPSALISAAGEIDNLVEDVGSDICHGVSPRLNLLLEAAKELESQARDPRPQLPTENKELLNLPELLVNSQSGNSSHDEQLRFSAGDQTAGRARVVQISANIPRAKCGCFLDTAPRP